MGMPMLNLPRGAEATHLNYKEKIPSEFSGRQMSKASSISLLQAIR